MLVRAYRAAGWRVNMIKDNIEMDIKKWWLWLAEWTEFDQYIILWLPLSAMVFDSKS
jgi:hypothetical protein